MDELPVSTRDASGSRLRVGGPYEPWRDPTVILLSLIVVGAATAFVLGVGPADGVGPSTGPVFPLLGPGDGGDDAVELRVRPNDSDVRVGEDVEFRVVTADEDPVADATLRVGERRYRTDARGSVVVSFASVDSYAVRASKAPANGTEYRPANLTVAVERRTVTLSVTTNRTNPETGDPVGVRVTLPDGTPTNASVRVGDRRATTGPDGEAVFRFPTAGAYELAVGKPPNATVRFVADPPTVSVGRRAVDLSVTVEGEGHLPGDPVTVRVARADTGEARNASVTVGDVSRATGPDGTVTLRFDRAGRYRVTAAAGRTPSVRFRRGEATVEVRRRTVDLSLSVLEDRVRYGEAVTYVLRRADSGRRVPGTVRVAGRALPTDRNGTLTLIYLQPGPLAGPSELPGGNPSPGEFVRLVPGAIGAGESGGRRPTETLAGGTESLYAVGLDPGVIPARALKSPSPTERFVGDDGRVLLVGPDFAVAGVAVAGPAPAGGSVNVTVTVENRGNDPAATPVVARLAGERVGTRAEVDLSGTARVTLSVPVPEDPGVYDLVVAVDGERVRTTVAVRRNESDGMLAPGARPAPRAARP